MTKSELNAMNEIYSEIDAERLEREEELKRLRVEQKAITALLNSYSIPLTSKSRPLTLLERIDYSLKMLFAKGVYA